MRKQEKSRRLLKAAFAAVLACGMMVPAGAAAWADDEKELVPPPFSDRG